tara:strand:- start:262 stop:531 length:270 start_codon:yes stop_codon:yes gene_type:complete
MSFSVLSYVQHREQTGISGLVLHSDCSNTTIYDPGCENDDDFPEIESYGPGSDLSFRTHDLEQIEKPSQELIDSCKCATKSFEMTHEEN